MSKQIFVRQTSQCLALCALCAATLCAPALSASEKPVFGITVRDQVGVNIHFRQPMPGEMEMIHRLGIGVIRMDCAWNIIETQKGVYDFRDYDILVQNLEKYHIRPLLILDYGNPLYFNNGTPDDPEWRADFTRWADATVTHFAGHHILWEMWNEPNWNKGEWYAHLAVATGIALRASAPGETYIGPACGGIDTGYIEDCFKTGALDSWQAVSVHPYRTTNPETLDYQSLKDLVKKYQPAGENIPVLSGEWGYTVIPAGNTYSFVTSDAMQARYFDREMLWNMVNAIPLSIWYDWRNDEEKPGATEANFGLVHFPYQAGQTFVFEPKPSFFAASFFMRALGDYRYENRVPLPDVKDGYLVSFVKNGTHRYTAWTTAEPISAVLPIPPGKYMIFDLMGNEKQKVTVNTSGLPLTLTGDVQFIIPN